MGTSREPRDVRSLPEEIAGELQRALASASTPSARQRVVESLCAVYPQHSASIRSTARRRTAPLAETVRFGEDGVEAAAPPASIGPYRILELLGGGGMGTVYKAEQRVPMRRLVALKVIREGLATREVLARFELERRALAAMNHRSIAKVLDAGVTERGEPYFVMELVEGLPLTDYCDKHRLTVSERVSLFQQVCRGVQHAHQKGVIHRDLKPSNVMVVREGDDAVAKILDFGLAKATNRDFLEVTLYTERDRIMGTPEYMSPEQAAGDGEVIDSRSDIYSLGVMLYELLAGELPFPTKRLRSAGKLDALRIIREEDPPRPSTVLSARKATASTLAGLRRTSVGGLSKALKGDLDWVVMRAMAKEPERRYDSAAGLALELQRYLDHEPVLAGPPSAGYRLSKLARRYRIQLGAAAAVVVALIAGLVMALLAKAEANRARQAEVEERTRAEENARRAEENAGRAGEQEQLAKTRATEIERQKGELAQRQTRFDMLAQGFHLENARAREALLYPARPERAGELRDWIERDAKRLIGALRPLRETVAALGQRTGAPTGNDGGPVAEEADLFLRNTLDGVIRGIEELEQQVLPDVKRRLTWADHVYALTVERFEDRWAQAAVALARADGSDASELYRGHPIALEPQVGLVPIGMNPVTKLWEFYDLRSAWDPEDPIESARRIEIPQHDAKTGHIAVGRETGIVFVLVPGTTFTMGATSSDARHANYDPLAENEEGPPFEVVLAPYFIARHELTQGQWQRLAGRLPPRPSTYGAGSQNFLGGQITWAHPVDSVSFASCDALLSRAGLSLPTEAQWECACRAGTHTAWWTGADREALRGAANLADATALKAGARFPAALAWPTLEDGYCVHAPVDALRPNPWGLHHVHGNVFEWCLDVFGDYPGRRAPGTGLRIVSGATQKDQRVTRGGTHDRAAESARSSFRFASLPEVGLSVVGVRAARAVETAH